MRSAVSSLAVALLALACAGSDPASRAPAEGESEPGAVTIYDPNAAWNGFTLGAYHRQYPILIDMRGRVVRSWPEMRVKSRIRLTPECTLIGIGKGRSVVEHDWHDDKIWNARFEDRFPHHDLVRTAAGTTLVLTRTNAAAADDVVEVDQNGDVVWLWRSAEWLGSFIEERARRRPADPTHMNSVRELPENPWFDAGDERFRPGNVLVSARNLNLVFIIDRPSGEVVWTYQTDLNLQHEALMIDARSDPTRRGNMMIFNNRYAAFLTDRLSRVIEIEPPDGKIVWSYSAPGFYSATSGAEQPLPNGNVLITSSTAGRAFEVDRSGRIVWEWVPGYKLDRLVRYPADHCAELATLGPPDGPPVRPPKGYRHIDQESYRFSREGHRTRVALDGVQRPVLKPEHRCAPLLIPGGASVALEYGVDRSRIQSLGLEGYSATFTLTLTNPESGGAATVFEETVGADGPAWREATLSLEALAQRRVEMCVGLEEHGPDRPEDTRLAYWASPRVTATSELAEEEGLEGQTDLTPEEREVQLEHLRAMGYVN